MQSTNRHRIELLISLVLFAAALAVAWTSSQADAGGLPSLHAPSMLSAAKPGATLASGDPDIGQGCPPKQYRRHGNSSGQTVIGWVRWTGRIWATLYMRAAL